MKLRRSAFSSSLLVTYFLMIFDCQAATFDSERVLPTSVEIARLTRNCVRNPAQPATVFTVDSPCDPLVNCLYGGVCKNVTNEEGRTTHPNGEVCRCSTKCPKQSRHSDRQRDYVCGSDGRTYENDCMLKIASCRCQYPIQIKWRGSCEKGPRNSSPIVVDTIRNGDIVEPEAGSGSGDGNGEPCGNRPACKYGGVCDPDAEDGPCLCHIDCHGTPTKHVCGTDGSTYNNQCHLKATACQDQVGIEVEHIGKCKNTLDDDVDDETEESGSGQGVDDEELNRREICSRTLNCQGEVIKPVCGSDGQSHANRCAMRLEACVKNKRILVVHDGFCNLANPHKGTPNNKPNPCDSVMCLHGAVCVAEEADDFQCSCDAICTEGSYYNELHVLPEFKKISQEDLKQFLGKEYAHDDFPVRQPQRPTTTTTTTTATTTTTRKPGTRRRPLVRKSDEAVDVIAVDDEPFQRVHNWERNADRAFLRTDTQHGGVKAGQRTHRVRLGRRHSSRHKRNAEHTATSELESSTAICASDGKTYKNECQMKIHACHTQKKITVKRVGACPQYAIKEDKHTLSWPAHTSKITLTESKTTTESTFPASTTKTMPHKSLFSDASATEEVIVKDTHNYTSSPNTHTDSQTKSTTLGRSYTSPDEDPVMDSDRVINPPENTQPTLLENKARDEPVSEAHAVEYSWLIAVTVFVALVAIGLVTGCCYRRRSQSRAKQNEISEEDAKSCETLIVVTANDASMTSFTSLTADLPNA